VKLTRKTETPEGELSSWASFSTRSYHDCTVTKTGPDAVTFLCLGEECEEMGCTPDNTKMILSKGKFTIGKVSCNLEKN
jgi:hypothetical protein